MKADFIAQMCGLRRGNSTPINEGAVGGTQIFNHHFLGHQCDFGVIPGYVPAFQRDLAFHFSAHENFRLIQAEFLIAVRGTKLETAGILLNQRAFIHSDLLNLITSHTIHYRCMIDKAKGGYPSNNR